MASDNETVEDIVMEMRNEFPPKYCSSKHCRVEVYQPVRSFADRLEASHRREVAELRECLDSATNIICGKCYDTVRAKCARGERNDCEVKRLRKALEGANNEKND